MQLGQYNQLTITRFTDHGAYLDGGEVGEILMPKAYVADEMRPGDTVSVFVYLDSEQRLVATTETPLARVGDFACLRVNWVNEYGAFLDWGVMKDLFVPFREQKRRMEVERYYTVRVYIDDATHRIVGTAKVERYLRPASPDDCPRGREVDLLVQQRTERGYKVIVDNAYAGMVYYDQAYRDLRVGERLRGYVSQVRPDGKLDISLQSLGTDRFRDFAEVLLDKLREAGGHLPYGDDTPADEIARRFAVSKKTFKRAIGTLYRQGQIHLVPDGISLGGEPCTTRPAAPRRDDRREKRPAPRPRIQRPSRSHREQE